MVEPNNVLIWLHKGLNQQKKIDIVRDCKSSRMCNFALRRARLERGKYIPAVNNYTKSTKIQVFVAVLTVKQF